MNANRPKGLTWQVLRSATFLGLVLVGIALHTGLLWYSGRYSPGYFMARCAGLVIGVLLPAMGIALWRIHGDRMIKWWCVVCLSGVLQLFGGTFAMRVFMHGFERAILAANDYRGWKHAPQLITGASPVQGSINVYDRLPTFIERVYPGFHPHAIADRHESPQRHSAFVFWRSTPCIGILINQEFSTQSYLPPRTVFRKQISEGLEVLAFYCD